MANAKGKCNAWRLFRGAEDADEDGGKGPDHRGGAPQPVSGERRQDKSAVAGVADGLRTEIFRADTDTEAVRLQGGRGESGVFTDRSCRERERESVPGESLRTAGMHTAWDNWPHEPELDRVVDGLPDRVDRLKCLGNAVVPQQFYPFFAAIAEIEGGTMENIPDAPWISDPEPYITEYYGKPVFLDNDEEEDDEV